MKLKDILEMSLPTIRNEEDAVEKIRQAYQAAVVKKQPEGDYLGPLQAAMKYLQNVTNPEKYRTEIKKGSAAMRAIKNYASKTSSKQARFSASRGR